MVVEADPDRPCVLILPGSARGIAVLDLDCPTLGPAADCNEDPLPAEAPGVVSIALPPAALLPAAAATPAVPVAVPPAMPPLVAAVLPSPPHNPETPRN